MADATTPVPQRPPGQDRVHSQPRGNVEHIIHHKALEPHETDAANEKWRRENPETHAAHEAAAAKAEAERQQQAKE
jgi:hypothetical protein